MDVAGARKRGRKRDCGALRPWRSSTTSASAYLGRKSDLKQALREVRDRESGMSLNAVRERSRRRSRSARPSSSAPSSTGALAEEVVDVTLPGDGVRARAPPPDHPDPPRDRGRLPRPRLPVVDGREVETTHYNFDALNFPHWHPARSRLASLFLNGDVLLRTETSPSQIRVMEAEPPPIAMISLGRVYRRDTPDATHSPIFHQVEGLVVDRGITLADLKGTLLHLMRALFGEERGMRFRTHYFPFTEPSMEPDVSCFACDGSGCRVCKHSGWIEMGGSGMVDPRVLEYVRRRPRGVDRASRSASASSGSRSSATASPTSGSSGTTTCAS